MNISIPGPRLFITLYLQVSLPLPDIQKLLAELLCHCIDLCRILITEGRHDLYIVLKPCNIFTLLLNIPFMTLAAVGAQLPFSMRPMVRFW